MLNDFVLNKLRKLFIFEIIIYYKKKLSVMSYYASMRNSQENTRTYRNYNQVDQSGFNQNTYKSQLNNIQNSHNNSNKEIFKPKTHRFQWKNINQINISEIKSTQNISSLNPYIENILCSSLEQNEIQQIPEHYTVQLIHLLQTIGEYLLWSQQVFANENDQFRSELKNAYSNNHNDNDDLIQTLKMQNGQKDTLIKTYQNMLNKDKAFSVSSSRDEYENRQSRPKFYCQFCSNKKFSTEQYLEDHIRRRHLNQIQNLQKQNRDKDYESQLNEIKTYFETMMRSTQKQKEYNTINDKLNELENKFRQSRIDMDMQNRFAMSMNAMRSMAQSGQIPIYDNQPIVMQNEEEIIGNKNIQYAKEQELQNTLIRIDENIESNTREFNNKFNSLLNDMNQFKNSMSNEISKVKQDRSFERSKQKQMKTLIENRNNSKLSLQKEIILSQGQIVEVPEGKHINNQSKEQNETEMSNVITTSMPQQTIQQEKAISQHQTSIIQPIIEKNESIQFNNNSEIKHFNENQIEKPKQQIETLQMKSPLLNELEFFYQKFHQRDYNILSINQYKEQL